MGRMARLAAGMSLLLAIGAGSGNPSLAMGRTATETGSPRPTVDPRAISATAGGGHATLLVTAQGYPDLTPAARMMDKAARTRFVFEALTRHADKAQSGMRRAMEARGLATRSLWLINALAVEDADQEALETLSARSDIARIDLDNPRMELPTRPGPQSAGSASSQDPQAVGAIEWGVARVNAPAVWADGYRGQGIVIANLDTGQRWDHNALKPQYRGWNGVTATHDFNWFDGAALFSYPNDLAPVASPSAIPFDDQGHGTHTTGTAVGDDGLGHQIGVAPGSRWIGCRNMNYGYGSVARYTACFQFALAPTDVQGNNPNPALAADITSNSWGCDPGYNGGEPGCEVQSALITATQALHDAGIMVVASAGNGGSGCTTVDNAPGMLDQAFSVGAINSVNAIAGFSSRGPSAFTGRIKPDVVAPGVNVYSSLSSSTASYGALQGTSMAAPHVAGVAALLWSAAPYLRGMVDESQALLERTAQPLTTSVENCNGVPGTQVPNNTFGHGLIDARAAVSQALDGSLLIASVVPVTTALAGVPFTVTATALSHFSVLTLSGALMTVTAPAGIQFVDVLGIGQGQTRTVALAPLAPGQALQHVLRAQSAVTGVFTFGIAIDARINAAGVPFRAVAGAVIVTDTVPTGTGSVPPTGPPIFFPSIAR